MHYAKRCLSATQVCRASQTYKECRNDGAQLSESTATMHLQPAFSAVESMSNSTMQQHTPGLEFSAAVLSKIRHKCLQQQQHAPGLGKATSGLTHNQHT